MLRMKSSDHTDEDIRQRLPAEGIDAMIGKSIEIEGNLKFSGGLRIDGRVQGDVTSADEKHPDSVLIIGESGIVEGNVSVPHVIVNGTVKGKLVSSSRIELQARARVHGDVHYSSIEMELGAMVNGNLSAQGNTATDGSGPAVPSAAKSSVRSL